MTTDEVFTGISAHMIVGVMIHEDTQKNKIIGYKYE